MTQLIHSEISTAIKADREFRWLKDAEYVAQNTAEEEIVVDISDVVCISSRELNELIRLHLGVREQGRKLVLQYAQHQLWEIVTLTRLNRLIEFRDPATTA